MIKVGIIGLGFMGRMHLAAWEKVEGVEVVAVADRDAKKAGGDLSGGWGNIEGGVERLDMGKTKGTTDWRELVGWAEVDVVDVCVGTPVHEEVAVGALEAGKHVICEKPLARESDAARRIVEAAGRSAGYFMPAMCMRFWPEWAWLVEAVRDRRYGKVRDASFRRVGGMPPGWFRDGSLSGGGILDLHVHDSDFVMHAFGRPLGVSSGGYSLGSGCVDHVVTRYVYEDGGPIVYAEGSWGMAEGFAFSCRYCVNFEGGVTADFDMGREEPLVVYEGGEGKAVSVDGDDGYVEELRYFVGCVREGMKPTVVTGADAVASIELVEAEARSVGSGKIEKL